MAPDEIQNGFDIALRELMGHAERFDLMLHVHIVVNVRYRSDDEPPSPLNHVGKLGVCLTAAVVRLGGIEMMHCLLADGADEIPVGDNRPLREIQLDATM